MSCTACDTQISGTVTIAANAPPGVATITVTSTGYYGSGFISTGGGSSSSATAQATITFTHGAAPTIIWGVDSGGNLCGGTNIAGQTQNVVVGQQIAFTGCFSVPQGATMLLEYWSPSVPPGSVVSGYNASTAGGCVVPFAYQSTTCDPPTPVNTTCLASGYCDFPTFYWVDTGGNGSTFTFTYEYALNGSVVRGSASLPFGISAPTGVYVGTDTSGVQIWAGSPPEMQLGGNFAQGISFNGSGTPPPGNAGTFTWIQLLSSDRFPRIDSGGRWLCVPPAFDLDPPTPPPSILDNEVPYGPSGLQTSDSPSIGLVSDRGEQARSLSATMYLMWTPVADTRCTSGAACTIPVPQGYVNWSFCGDAVNTLATQQSNDTTWTLSDQCVPQPGQFQASHPTISNHYLGYPEWQKTSFHLPDDSTFKCRAY
jgi:hypothetical protein